VGGYRVSGISGVEVVGLSRWNWDGDGREERRAAALPTSEVNKG
jgi:hypothetical protein